MAVTDNFRLTNDNTSKGIKFHWGGNVTDVISLNSVTIPIPGETSENNVVTNIGGLKRLITFDFRLVNDGTDKSTSSDSKITLQDQWDFLMDTVVEGSTAGEQHKVSYTIQIYRNGVTKTFTGILQQVQVNPSDGSPFIEGSLTLEEGSNPLAS